MVHPLPAKHNRPATGVKGTADASLPLAPRPLGPIPKAASSEWPNGGSALIHRNPDTTHTLYRS